MYASYQRHQKQQKFSFQEKLYKFLALPKDYLKNI